MSGHINWEDSRKLDVGKNLEEGGYDLSECIAWTFAHIAVYILKYST